MAITIEDIYQEMGTSVSEQNSENKMKCTISDLKMDVLEWIEMVMKVDKALIKVTWIENVQEKDESEIRELLKTAKKFNEQAEEMYRIFQSMNRPSTRYRKEFKALREAIDLQLEGVFEVERIIFNIRKDQRYTALFDLAEEL